MTTYRDTRFVEAAVQSVLAQTFQDFELVVVDDGSENVDHIRTLVGVNEHIRFVALDANRGAAGAVNAGVAVARADLIARVDSDDLVAPTWLEKSISALMDDRTLGLVGSSGIIISERDEVLAVHAMPQTDFEIRLTLLSHCPFFHSGTVYRRELFDLAGGYGTDPVSHDHFLWWAMLPFCRARNLSEPLVRYRYNSIGVTASAPPGLSRQRTWEIRRSIWGELGLSFPLEDPQLGDEMETMLRGWPSKHPDRWSDLTVAVQPAIQQLEKLATVMSPSEQAAARAVLSSVSDKLTQGPIRPVGAFRRLRLVIQRRGVRRAAQAAGRLLVRSIKRTP